MKKKLLLFGKSQIGSGHVRDKLPNQDCFATYNSKYMIVIIASDGVGNCASAEIGSKAACKAVIAAAKYLRVGQKKSGAKNIKYSALPKLIHNYWIEGVKPYPPNECCATCLFAIYTKKFLVVGRLGDGFLALVSKSGKKDLLLKDDKTDSFANVTEALYDTFKPESWDIRQLRSNGYNNITIYTDGVPFEKHALCFARDVRREYLKMK